MFGLRVVVLVSFALLLPSLSACKGDEASPVAGKGAKGSSHARKVLDVHDPEACRACHEGVVEEFLTSMHAKAHQSQDPIFAGVRGVRVKREGDKIGAKCATCHSPRDPELGVTCGTCHGAKSVTPGKLGVHALVAGEPGMLIGPNDLAATAAGDAHGTGKAPAHIKDGTTLCLACHETLKNGVGVVLCDTGTEHRARAGAAGKKESCTSCHMPRVDGPSGSVASNKASHPSHRFLGPHQAWYGKDASFLTKHLTLKATLKGANAVVTLENLSGHSFPTGFPGRFAMLKAKGVDAQGKVVWNSPGPGPRTELAPHVLKKVYVTAEGKPTLAPYGVKIAVDSRLKPSEKRTVTWPVPAEVVEVRVAVVFRLLPPPLAKKLKLTKALEAEPRIIAKTVAKRAAQ